MRIAFLLQDLEFGGTQRQTIDLASRLDPERYRPELWVMKTGDDFRELAAEGRLSVTWLSGRSTIGPIALAGLWRHLRATPVDVLCLMTVVPNIWGRILGRAAKVPAIVATCRGGASAARQHERLLWPLADHHIVNADAVRRDLVERCGVPQARVSLIPNGVDIERFRPPAGPGETRAPVVLCVARLVPDKGHACLLGAFEKVAARFPRSELWLVGEGHRRGAIERRTARSPARDRIRLLGSRPDLPDLLSRATVFALSSVREAMPNALLEAMAAGVPVVATAAGGIPEAVRHEKTGLLVEPGDATAMAGAIVRLMGEAETRQRLSAAALDMIRSRHTLEAMVRGHEALFARLALERADNHREHKEAG